MIADFVASNEFWSAVAGAVAGALAGAIPAYTLAVRSSKQVLKRDKTQRFELEKAVVSSIYVKLLHIANNAMSGFDHLKAGIERDKPEGESVSLGVPAIAGFTELELIAFEASEIALCAKAGSPRYGTELQWAARRHSGFIKAMTEYGVQREKISSFTDNFPVTGGDPTVSLSYLMSDSDVLRLRRMEFSQDAFLQSIMTNLSELIDLVNKLVSEFRPLLSDYFDESFNLDFIPNDDSNAAAPDS